MSFSILVIEDEMKIINFIKRGLQEEGYTVDVANNTQLGYFLADTNKYNLIILDITIYGMEGLKLYKKLKDKRIGSPVFIIATEDTIYNDITSMFEGVDRYITKPFEFDEFLLNVYNILRKPVKVLR